MYKFGRWCPKSCKLLILRGAQAHAGADATVAAAAGSVPEDFHLVFSFSTNSGELNWSQTSNPQTEQGQANHGTTGDGDPSRYANRFTSTCMVFFRELYVFKKKSVFFSATSSAPSSRGTVKESSVFVDELNTANSFKHKARVAHTPKCSPPGNYFCVFFSLHWPTWNSYVPRKPSLAHKVMIWMYFYCSLEDRGPLVEIKIGSSFQPFEGTSEATNPLRPPWLSQKRPAAPPGAPKTPPLPQLPKDVALEKYSGLRLRWNIGGFLTLPLVNFKLFPKKKKILIFCYACFSHSRRPRVSSSEMQRKMADRRLVRLSQLPERLAREKLEDSDWVTFAVVVNKAAQKSNNSVGVFILFSFWWELELQLSVSRFLQGKTFSIWKLNDLHNLDVFVSLLLFGDVHKEHWKTDVGTVIGLLNANPMKQKDGYDGVSGRWLAHESYNRLKAPLQIFFFSLPVRQFLSYLFVEIKNKKDN